MTTIFKENGTIRVDNGQLIIDLTNMVKNPSHRNITIVKTGDNEIKVNALIINMLYFYPYGHETISFSPNIYEEEYFKLVSEDMIEEVEEKIEANTWQCFWNIEPTKTKKIRRIKQSGWIELKDTNHPVEFITNNYLIVQ